MFGKHVFALLLLSVFFFVTRAYTQEAPPESIVGTYYFKGIGLLEIRAEGDGAVTETPDKHDIWKGFVFFPGKSPTDAEKTLFAKLEQFRHRGRLASPQSIDFGTMDLTFENVLKHFGLTEADLPPEEKSAIQKELGGASVGSFFERWNLFPGGHLEIDSAAPIFTHAASYAPSAQEEQAKLASFLTAFSAAMTAPAGPGRDVLAEFRQANPQLCKRVCGWKIAQVGEIEGWKALEAQQYAQAAASFQQAAGTQLASPFPCFGEAWARIGTREFEPARRALQTGVSRLTPETRPFLEEFAFFLRDQIYSYETQAAGANSDYLALADTFASRWPPETRKQDTVQKFRGKKARTIKAEELAELKTAVSAFPLWQDIQKAVTMRGRGPLLPLGSKVFSFEALGATKPPDMSEQQTIAAMAIFSGHLWRAQGKFPNAIYQYATVVRLGQILRRGTLISHLIGIALEQLGVGALLDLFEDGFLKDAPTLQSMTEMVDYLDKSEPRPEPGEAFAYEATAYPVVSDPFIEYKLASSGRPDLSEFDIRQKFLQARLAVLQALCALKKQCLAAPYPEKLDPAMLPADPFVPAEKLRYIYKKGEERATVYSIGPDQRDQGAALRYDPTNGAASAGDIWLSTL